MANLWLNVLRGLFREQRHQLGYNRREREFWDSDCLCLSFFNIKTFTNGCGYIFCKRFVTSWYPHKNKYLHKFRVWEDAVDKPSRLVKCWGKHRVWNLAHVRPPGPGSCCRPQPRSPACRAGGSPAPNSGCSERTPCSPFPHQHGTSRPPPYLCRDTRAARGGRELRPFSPNVRGNLGFGEKQSMQRLIPSDAGPGKPVLKKPVAFSVLKLRTGSRFCFSSSVLGVQLATKATERGAQVHSWRGTGLCYL